MNAFHIAIGPITNRDFASGFKMDEEEFTEDVVSSIANPTSYSTKWNFIYTLVFLYINMNTQNYIHSEPLARSYHQQLDNPIFQEDNGRQYTAIVIT